MKITEADLELEQSEALKYVKSIPIKFEGVLILDGICGLGKTTGMFAFLNAFYDYANKSEGEEYKDDRFIYVAPYLSECHRIAGTLARGKVEESQVASGKLKTNKYLSGDEARLYNEVYLHRGKQFHLLYGQKIKGFNEPTRPTKYQFYHPLPDKNSRTKLESVKNLIRQNQNIITTHSLLQRWDEEVIDLLATKKYHLIIDEEPPVIQSPKYEYEFKGEIVRRNLLSSQEFKTFVANDILKINSDTKALSWNDSITLEGNVMFQQNLERYKDLKDLCNAGVLYSYPVTKEAVLASISPTIVQLINPKIFSSFRSCRILTYLFEESFAEAYLSAFKIPYRVHDLTEENYCFLVDLKAQTAGKDGKTGSYLNITIPNKLNKLEVKPKTRYYSKGWYNTVLETKDPMLEQLKTSTTTFFKQTEFEQNQYMWTCYKDHREKIKSTGYLAHDTFSSCNLRASNDYRHKRALAYLVKIVPNTALYNFLTSFDNAVRVNQEKFALSMFIQWLYRSALRDNQPIDLFIASKKLRLAFEAYLDQQSAKIKVASEDFYDRYKIVYGMDIDEAADRTQNDVDLSKFLPKN